MTPNPNTDVLAAEVRRLGARVAKLEDAVQMYGPPPKTRRIPIPEITTAQREFLVWVAFFGILSLITAAVRSRGGGE